MNNRKLLAAIRKCVLIKLELVRCFERVVTADRNQCVRTQRAECFIGRLHWSRLFSILKIDRRLNQLAWVCPGSADDDAALVAGSLQRCVVEHDEVAAFLHRIVRVVFHQVSVTVHYADDFDAAFPEARSAGRDDCIGCRSRSTGKQNGDFPEVVF